MKFIFIHGTGGDSEECWYPWIREELESKLNALEQEFEGKDIPRPNFWGGYIVKPIEIEFWQGSANRLHDRVRYRLQPNYNWEINRLAP